MDLNMVRPVKSFVAVLKAVIIELQSTSGAKVKVTIEVEAEADNGFADADIGVLRNNAKQLRFKAESTGFE